MRWTRPWTKQNVARIMLKYESFLLKEYLFTPEVLDCFEDTSSHVDAIDPFYQYGLTLIPACISIYNQYKVWDESPYPFPNFKGATVDV